MLPIVDNYHSAIESLLKRGQYVMQYEDPISSYWCEMCGKDTYLTVHFYYRKLDNDKCFSNGYYFVTNRTLKLSDILMEQRKIKLEKILK